MSGTTSEPAAHVHRFVLLTDIAQSSRLAEHYPHEYMTALGQHNQLVEDVAAHRDGLPYKQVGDGYLVLFQTAGACLGAAAELGVAFGKLEPLADDAPVGVRIALHAGTLQPSGEEYFGPALNRVSRICQVCNPGQVLLSGALAVLVEGDDGTIRKSVMPDPDDATLGLMLRDLGWHPLRDLAEPEQLYQLDSECFSQREFPPLATLDNRPNNLVRQPNHFIGREKELSELAEILQDDTHLLSIVAPGGYGKSRLAAQLCANLLNRFANGVFMTYLAPVRESGDVPTAIANALGYRLSGGRTPEQQLCDFLRQKELLLCLDNFEHLPDSAPLVADLLRAAPKLKVIITSREPLRLQGERTCRLEPLPIEVEDGKLYSESQSLFADRAALASSGFALSAENAAQVQQVCRQLAGIPLAIELAAAWMDTFTLGELGDELSQQLELEARASDRPERHRSLTACLDWSWQLLGEEQQINLMKLSTFRGGFFSEAAGAVLSMKGMALRATLGRLVDKSWLYTRDVDGQTRFFLRDMLAHEYAFARLAQTRGADDSLFEQAVGAHAAYYAALADREGPRLKGGGVPDGGAVQLAALRSWRLELDNILEALDSGVRRGEARWLIPIAENLHRYLGRGGDHFTQRDRYLVLVDTAQRTGSVELLQCAQHGLGRALRQLGDNDGARAALEQAMALFRENGDHQGEASCLDWLGYMAIHQGNFEEARSLHTRALAYSREGKNRHGEAGCLGNLGILEVSIGNFKAARSLHTQALALYRELGDRLTEATCLGNLGVVDFMECNYSAAGRLWEQELAYRRELGDTYSTAGCLHNLGNVDFMQCSYSAARELYEQALGINRESGHRTWESHNLLALGRLEQYLGYFSAARAQFAQCLNLVRELGYRHMEAQCLNGLGCVEYGQDNCDSARALCSEALAIMREIGDREGIATCLVSVGIVESRRGDRKAAQKLFAEALSIAGEIGLREGEANSLHGLAVIHLDRGDSRQAQELLGQAMTIRSRIGDYKGLCDCLIACAALLANTGNLEPAAVCQYGALHYAEQCGLHIAPLEGGLSARASELIEHPETGLPATELEQLKTQAVAMSIDELAGFAPGELEALRLDMDVAESSE